jgi:CHAT domain-containing protein
LSNLSLAYQKIGQWQEATAAVFYPIILEDRLEIILNLPQQPLRHYYRHPFFGAPFVLLGNWL